MPTRKGSAGKPSLPSGTGPLDLPTALGMTYFVKEQAWGFMPSSGVGCRQMPDRSSQVAQR